MTLCHHLEHTRIALARTTVTLCHHLEHTRIALARTTVTLCHHLEHTRIALARTTVTLCHHLEHTRIALARTTVTLCHHLEHTRIALARTTVTLCHHLEHTCTSFLAGLAEEDAEVEEEEEGGGVDLFSCRDNWMAAHRERRPGGGRNLTPHSHTHTCTRLLFLQSKTPQHAVYCTYLRGQRLIYTRVDSHLFSGLPLHEPV